MSFEHHPQPPTIEDFTLLKPLSSGAFGTVHLGVKKSNPSHVYAIKCLKKSDLLRKNLTTQVVQERSALLNCNSNEFSVKLYYSLQTHTNVYFVMEYCVGGDLKSLLSHMRFFQIQMAGFYVAEIATALDYLHSRGVTHRDIKPDNMLVHKTGHIKLTDFGLSEVGVKTFLQQDSSPLSTQRFTPGQIASLAQGITFNHCSSESPSSGSYVTANNSDETPVSTASSCANNTNNHSRKVRIPLRKLGSRGNLVTLNDSAKIFNSTTSSSWSVINTPEPKITYKRVKLTPDKAKPYDFNDSSYLSCSFKFRKIEKPTSLWLDVITSSPISTTPTAFQFSSSSPNNRPTSLFHSVFSPVLKENGKLDTRADGVVSPETGRFVKDHASMFYQASVGDLNRTPECKHGGSPSWPNFSKKRKRTGDLSTGLTSEVGGLVINKLLGTPESSSLPVRLLGTPDYLAPELIKVAMGKPQAVGFQVDWWALGVCLYEFVIGVLPFNDDTADLIFNNILNKYIEFPEGMDSVVVKLIHGLICLEPNQRFGFQDLKNNEFLNVFGLRSAQDWGNLGQLTPPFVPVVDSELDTAYFQ